MLPVSWCSVRHVTSDGYGWTSVGHCRCGVGQRTSVDCWSMVDGVAGYGSVCYGGNSWSVVDSVASHGSVGYGGDSWSVSYSGDSWSMVDSVLPGDSHWSSSDGATENMSQAGVSVSTVSTVSTISETVSEAKSSDAESSDAESSDAVSDTIADVTGKGAGQKAQEHRELLRKKDEAV